MYFVIINFYLILIDLLIVKEIFFIEDSNVIKVECFNKYLVLLEKLVESSE